MILQGKKKRPLKKKHVAIPAITLAVLLFTTTAIPCFAAENHIDWTEEELAFLKEHPVIRLGVDPEFMPFEFMDGDGEYKGIAEGVEYDIQLQYLKEHGCPKVQGYLISKPLNAEDAIMFLKKQEAQLLGYGSTPVSGPWCRSCF